MELTDLKKTLSQYYSDDKNTGIELAKKYEDLILTMVHKPNKEYRNWLEIMENNIFSNMSGLFDRTDGQFPCFHMSWLMESETSYINECHLFKSFFGSYYSIIVLSQNGYPTDPLFSLSYYISPNVNKMTSLAFENARTIITNLYNDVHFVPFMYLKSQVNLYSRQLDSVDKKLFSFLFKPFLLEEAKTIGDVSFKI